MKEIRTRFAPSPTGFMHIGNLRTALYAWLFARKNGGRFILRIEDTDRERQVENAVETIYNTLRLAGLDYDEGPDRPGDFGPYVQSERKDIYAQYARQLVDSGHAYYCFCSRERLESLTDESGNRRYDKHCLHLSKDEIEAKLAAGIPCVIRQNVPTEGVSTFNDLVFGEISVENRELHDNVLLKSDGYPTYNFANVVDDHLMRISHVLRGMEYLSSTPNYNLLYSAFGWEIPQYIHLPHIMRDKQHKLSKRYGDANFEDFLAKGFLPQAILNYVALLGWNPKNDREKFSLDELVEAFDIAGISKSAAVFDEVKLRWLNSQYFIDMPPADFHRLASDYYADVPDFVNKPMLSAMLQPRVSVLSEIDEKIKFITNFDNFDLNLFEDTNAKSTFSLAKTILQVIIPAFSSAKVWENDALFEICNQMLEPAGAKRKQLLWVVRIALTGYASTPCGATEACVLLGREESLRRLRYSLERLEAAA